MTATINEAVQVSVPLLVRLNRQARALPLQAGRMLARQAGDYQSPFKGRGMEFDESRLYQPGDDVRNIDWRVTARTGKPHTKLFREERERPVFLWIDLCRPMFFATRGCYKSVVAARLAGLLGWSAVAHGDRIGGVVFSDTVHHELKPRRGKSAVLRLINQIVHYSAGPAEGASADAAAAVKAVARLRRLARPGSLVFLISDFRYFDDAAETQLAHISRHSDMILIFVYDPLEEALPPPGRYRISDGNRDLVLDTYDREWVLAYSRKFAARRQRLTALTRRYGMYLLECSTQDDPLVVLQSGLVAPVRR